MKLCSLLFTLGLVVVIGGLGPLLTSRSADDVRQFLDHFVEEADAVAFHCHPVPTFGYVLEGSIRVRLKSGRERLFHQGEALAEVVNTLHKGVPVGGPVEFVVFYAGASGMEVSLAADDPRCREQPPGS